MSITSDVRQIFDQVRANLHLLNNCPGPHDFVCLTPEKPLGAKYRCTVCGGTTRGDSVKWYQEGLAHGKKSQ